MREETKKMNEEQQKRFDEALAGFLKKGMRMQDAYYQVMRAYPELFSPRDLRMLKIHDSMTRSELKLEKLAEATPEVLKSEVSRTEVKRPLLFEEEVIRDWKADPELQKEFKTFLTYFYFRKAEKAGHVKIIGRGK